MDKIKVYLSSLIIFIALVISLNGLFQIYQASNMSLINKLSFALTNTALSTIEFNET